jgi:HNH endonuclease
MPRKPTKKGLTTRLDREWSLKVREKAGNACERCGAQATQVHHIHSRRFRRLRWRPENMMSICARCHRFAHDCPTEFIDWFRTQRPADYVFLLDPDARAPISVSVSHLEDLLEELKAA